MKEEEYIEQYFIDNNIPLKTLHGIDTVAMTIIGRKVGCSGPVLSRFNKKWFPLKPPGIRLKNYITNLNSLQSCNSCKQVLDYSNFYKSSVNFNKISHRCKDCESIKAKIYYIENSDRIKIRTNKYDKEVYKPNNREYLRYKESIRRTKKLQRTPLWADLEKIKEFYLNCPKGHEVDHIIPLQGRLISGLHVLNNLQYLTATRNRQKSNKWPYNFN